MLLNILNTNIPNFTHIIHLADIHCRLLKRHDEYVGVFNRLYDSIKKTPDTTVICVLGDIVHSKTDLSPECVQLAKDFLYSLSDLRPTILIAGNHDAMISNKSRLDSLSPIVDAIRHPQLFYLKQSGLYALGNVLFNNYSIFDDSAEKYIYGKDIPQIYRNKYEYFVALFHGPINNALTDLGFVVSNSSTPPEIFDYHDIALLGDIHMMQDVQRYNLSENIPTVHYCGSLIQQNHGETIHSHGYSLWDLKSRSYTHVDIPNDYGFFTVLINKGQLDSSIDNLPKKVILRMQCFESVQTEVKALLTKIRSLTEVIAVSYVRVESPEDKKSLTIGANIRINDLSNPDYQNELLADYLKKRMGVEDQKLINQVLVINKFVNESLKRDETNRNIRWRPKTFEFDNMFSYGEGNVIDFSKLHNVVGLFAPNTAGKSSILSALSFCIFDKCDREFKACNILNVQKMGFRCKFSFEVDGVDYFIERNGNADKNGNVKVNVRFWKCEGEQEVDLNGEGRRDTNEVIREYLGSYDDFVLTTLSVQNVKNVGSFIDMGHTDRKDLLAQFMGLTVYDRLYNQAYERYRELSVILKQYKNDDFTNKLVVITGALMQAESAFNSESEDSSKNGVEKEVVQKRIIENSQGIIKLEGSIPPLIVSEKDKKDYLRVIEECTRMIDDIQRLVESCEKESDALEIEIRKMEEMDLSKTHKQHQDLIFQRSVLQTSIERKKAEIRGRIERVERARDYKYNPECEFCLSNANVLVKEAAESHNHLKQDKLAAELLVDQLNKIKKNLEDVEWVVKMYETYTQSLEKRNKVKDNYIRYKERLDKFVKNLDEAKKRLEAVEQNIDLYQKNKESIEVNNKINIQIQEDGGILMLTEGKLKRNQKLIMELNGKITVFKTQIEEIKQKIQSAKQIEEEYKSYESYIQAISRDGIPYEVISSTVPEIEREINNILSQIVEFHVSLEVDGKNVVPYIVYDEKKWVMSLTSGFERFVLSLAIRVALINISNLPRPNFLVVDEGFGVLDAEHLPSVQTLFSYLKTNFDFILIVSHLDSLRDMVDTHVEIKKEGGFSRVNFE